MEKQVYAQALFDFVPSYADELKTQAGDVLQILYEIDEDWIYGKSLMIGYNDNTHVGILPKNFVRQVNIPDYLIGNSNIERIYLSIENFDFGEDGDLDFKKGEIMISQSDVDDNWVFGYCIKNLSRTGIFPLTHVVQIYIDPAEKPITKSEAKRSLSVPEPQSQPNKSILRQAISVEPFQNADESDQGFLRFSLGDYILVTGELDDKNWLIGENLNGERGIFPADYIQFISNEDKENEPAILNRTQRRYTMSSIEYNKSPLTSPIENKIPPPPEPVKIPSIEENVSNEALSVVELKTFHNDVIPMIEDEILEQVLPENSVKPVENTNKYCIVDFDFQPENENELGCIRGDYLKVIQMIDEPVNEWVLVENSYGQRGIVPLNYTTFLIKENPAVTKLFEQKPKNKLNVPGTTKPKLKRIINKTPERKSLEKIKQESSELDEQLKPSILINQTSKRSSSFTANNRSPTEKSPANLMLNNRLSYSKSPVKNRPPIPPKPKITMTKSSPNQGATSMNTRPVLYNNELLTNIKSLQTKIQNQLDDQKLNPNSHRFSLPEIKSVDNSNLTTLQNDLSSMKQIFVESALNRDMAIAQIDFNSPHNVLGKSPSYSLESDTPFIETKQILNEGSERAEEKKKKRLNERKYSILELFETEKSYCSELTELYHVFMNDDYNPPEFDKNALFEDLTMVTTFSAHLVDTLDHELESKNDNDIKIGKSLTEFSEEMKIIYAKYLQNHSNITVLIKNYENNPKLNDYITERLKLLPNSKLPTLQSLLIKPVQRIFKYPLFIKRIYDNTEQEHCDYINLKEALDVFTKMLNFINEYKRRKDLVSKYLSTSSEELTITDMIKKINFKAIKKKTTRISVQFSSLLGIYNQQIVDESFYRIETNFRIIEKLLRTFFSNLNEYLLCIKNLLDTESIYFQNLTSTFDDESSEKFVSLKSASESRVIEYRHFVQRVTTSISNPLEALLCYLNGPNKIIEKRNHKLVDYEACLSDVKIKSSYGPNYVSKELETQLDQSKKDYHALNDQLIEELPILTHKTARILNTCTLLFSSITKDYFKNSKINLTDQIEKHDLKLVHSSPSCEGSNVSDQYLVKHYYQTEAHRNFLEQNFESSKLFVVNKEYIANEKGQILDQKINDLVGYIKDHEANLWLVHNGFTEGLVPSDALEPYATLSQNLIDLDEKEPRSLVEQRSSLCNLPQIKEQYCVALYDFRAVMHNMIGMSEGDVYQVLEKHDKQDNGEWWLVESNDKVGYVPRSYIKLLD